jgi:hypothetical protein
MIASSTLAPLVPKLFSAVFDNFPEDELRRVVASPHVDQAELLWRLSSSSNTLHRNLHVELMARVLEGNPNLHNYRYVGNMLRSYSREELLGLLQPVTERGDDKGLWFLREVEAARQERLIDEAGRLLHYG